MDWFKHEVNCLTDDKLGVLCIEFGAKGYAVYFRSIEVLYANCGKALNNLALKRIANDLKLGLSDVMEVLMYASSEECGYLLKETEDGYISERVLGEVEASDTKKKKFSDMGKTSAERRSNASSTEVEHTLNVGSTDIDKEEEKENKKEVPKGTKKEVGTSSPSSRRIFAKPTVEDVRAYCVERRNNVDPLHFFDFYESKNWYVGKNKMSDWKACVRTWESKEQKTGRKMMVTNEDERMRDVNPDGSLNLLGD